MVFPIPMPTPQKMIMPTLSADDLIAFHKASGCPLSEARRTLLDLEPELRERILIASRSEKSDDLGLTDPIEQDAVIRRKVRQAGRRAEALVNGKGLGRCHAVWERQAQILWDDHGIRWYSPAQMNPLTDFD
jgi:hypothetical protein